MMWIGQAGAFSRWNHHANVKFSVSHCLPFGHGYDSTLHITARNGAIDAGPGRAAAEMVFSERG